MTAIERHETELLAYAEAALDQTPGVRLIGRPRHRAAAISFLVDGIHPHDLGTILDRHGIAIRAGHHCAQPAMKRLGVPGTARLSLAVYNQRDEIDYLVACLGEAQRMFRA